jgi:hypothetical protein
VKNCKATAATAKRPTEFVYFFCAIATMLTMTAAVKAIDSQRWVCRIHLFQLNGTSFEHLSHEKRLEHFTAEIRIAVEERPLQGRVAVGLET